MKNSKAQVLSLSSVACYLVVIPLIYAGYLHYMESMNSLIVVQEEGKIRAEMDQLKYLFADSTQIRKLMMFYDPANQYSPVSQTNEKFEYSFPLIGKKELKIIKGKEDNIFRSANEQLYVVDSSSDSERLLHHSAGV